MKMKSRDEGLPLRLDEQNNFFCAQMSHAYRRDERSSKSRQRRDDHPSTLSGISAGSKRG